MTEPLMSVEETRDALWAWLCGLRDALSFHESVLFFLTSSKVRVRTLQCVVLNLFIFLGSLFMVERLIMPLFHAILTEPVTDNATAQSLVTVGSWMSSAFSWAYQILWIYPIYCISFILSSIWYQDIADHAYLVRGGKRKSPSLTFARWVTTMAEEVYRLLLVTSFLVQLTLCSFIPVVGVWISTLHLSWLYAMYSFQYRWALEGWSLEEQLLYFEQRWPYFSGFGFPTALITVFFPNLVSSGLYAFSFPMFIILAIVAKPVVHVRVPTGSDTKRSRQAGRLPIFRYAKILNLHVLKLLHRKKAR